VPFDTNSIAKTKDPAELYRLTDSAARTCVIKESVAALRQRTKTAFELLRRPLFAVVCHLRVSEMLVLSTVVSVHHAQQGGQVALTSTGLFRGGHWGWSGWISSWSHGWSGGRSTSAGTTGGGSTGVAAAIDDVVSAQTQGLFSLTTDATIAVTQRTGQSGNDFWAAAAVLADLITDLVRSGATNSFICVVQTIDEGRHDFWVADAIISVAELTQGSSSLTSIASRL